MATRNYTKAAAAQINAAQLATNINSALGWTGTEVVVGITPTEVIVTNASLTAANDAAIQSAINAYVFDPLYDQRLAAKGIIGAASDNLSLVLRATAALLVDELNALRQWNTGLAAAVAAATSLADLKARVALLPALPNRTLAQAVAAVQADITAGSAD